MSDLLTELMGQKWMDNRPVYCDELSLKDVRGREWTVTLPRVYSRLRELLKLYGKLPPGREWLPNSSRIVALEASGLPETAFAVDAQSRRLVDIKVGTDGRIAIYRHKPDTWADLASG